MTATPTLDTAVNLRNQTYLAGVKTGTDEMFGNPRSKLNRTHKVLRDQRTPAEVEACFEIAKQSKIRSGMSKYRELLDKLEQTWAREFPDAPMPHPVYDYADWYSAFDGASSNHDFWALQWALYTNAVDTIVKEAY
jgi:hypothetical protein